MTVIKHALCVTCLALFTLTGCSSKTTPDAVPGPSLLAASGSAHPATGLATSAITVGSATISPSAVRGATGPIPSLPTRAGLTATRAPTRLPLPALPPVSPEASRAPSEQAAVAAVEAILTAFGQASVRVTTRTASGNTWTAQYAPPQSMWLDDPAAATQTVVIGERSWQREDGGPWEVVDGLDASPPETKLNPYSARQLSASGQQKSYEVDFGDGLTGKLTTDNQGRLSSLVLWTPGEQATPDVATYTYDPTITIRPPT